MVKHENVKGKECKQNEANQTVVEVSKVYENVNLGSQQMIRRWKTEYKYMDKI